MLFQCITGAVKRGNKSLSIATWPSEAGKQVLGEVPWNCHWIAPVKNLSHEFQLQGHGRTEYEQTLDANCCWVKSTTLSSNHLSRFSIPIGLRDFEFYFIFLVPYTGLQVHVYKNFGETSFRYSMVDCLVWCKANLIVDHQILSKQATAALSTIWTEPVGLKWDNLTSG